MCGVTTFGSRTALVADDGTRRCRHPWSFLEKSAPLFLAPVRCVDFLIGVARKLALVRAVWCGV